MVGALVTVRTNSSTELFPVVLFFTVTVIFASPDLFNAGVITRFKVAVLFTRVGVYGDVKLLILILVLGISVVLFDAAETSSVAGAVPGAVTVKDKDTELGFTAVFFCVRRSGISEIIGTSVDEVLKIIAAPASARFPLVSDTSFPNAPAMAL